MKKLLIATLLLLVPLAFCTTSESGEDWILLEDSLEDGPRLRTDGGTVLFRGDTEVFRYSPATGEVSLRP